MIAELERIVNKIIEDPLGVESKKGHEYNYFDKPVPSVTTILSKCIHEDYIVSWANYLGFKRIKYKDKLNEAAIAGTAGHNAVENYLKYNEIEDNIPLESFRLWWDMLNESNTVEILGIEERLILPYCGGTYDILLSINGRIFLVDLKTSNHLSYKYFIQLAAYRHMLYKVKNMNIDGCIILQLDKNVPSFNEQLLDFSIDEHYQFIEHCAFTFMSLVAAFYNIHKAEYLWNKLF